MYLGVGTNTLLAEGTSGSTVLDNLSINGLLAQYVQKAGRLPFGYPTGLLAQYVQKAGRLPLGYPNGLLAKIEHDFFLWQFIHSKLNIKRKISTDNRVFCNPCSIFMRIRCRVHTVYRIIFLPISTPMKILRCSCICSICFQYQRRYFCCLH